MLEKLKSELQQAVAQLGIAQGLQRYRLVAIWEEVVGEHLARQSEPLEVRDSQLVIKTTNSMWSQELLFRAPEIVRRIRAILENDQITKLRCRVGKVGTRSWLTHRKPEEVDWSSVQLGPASLARVQRIVDTILEPQIKASAHKALLQWERNKVWAYGQGMRPCLLCGSMQEQRLCFACQREQYREREGNLMRQLGRQPWMTLRELQGFISDVTQSEYFQARRRLTSIFQRNYWMARDTLPVGAPFPPGLRQLMLDLCMLTTGIDFENLQDRHLRRTFGKTWGQAFVINQVPDLSAVPKKRVRKPVAEAAAEADPRNATPRRPRFSRRPASAKKSSDRPTENLPDSSP